MNLLFWKPKVSEAADQKLDREHFEQLYKTSQNGPDRSDSDYCACPSCGNGDISNKGVCDNCGEKE